MDKVTPATKPVGVPDGLRGGSAATTLTTPDTQFGNYSAGYKNSSEATGKSIFSK